MKCPTCKRKNEWDAVYCKVCGNKLPDENVSWFRRHKKLTITMAILVIFYVFVYRSLSTFFADVERQQYEEDTIIAGSGEDIVALINIDGIIVDSEPVGGFGSLSNEYTSSRKIKRTLKDVSLDENVKGLVIRVNSPGGSAAASDQIFEDIKLFKNTQRIPVVAYFTDTAASGGYYVSMSADKIVANPANITGGVGVIVSYLNFADFIERYGIRDITYKSGET
jgi:protease IV